MEKEVKENNWKKNTSAWANFPERKRTSKKEILAEYAFYAENDDLIFGCELHKKVKTIKLSSKKNERIKNFLDTVGASSSTNYFTEKIIVGEKPLWRKIAKL